MYTIPELQAQRLLKFDLYHGTYDQVFKVC